MHLSIYNFEQQLNEKILIRGYAYYDEGRVNEPEEISSGEYEFIVEGSEDYIVEIQLTDGEVKDFFCECPYDGPVCKHVAAVLFYLSEKGSGLCQPGEPGSESRTLEQKVEAILEKLSFNDLKRFVLENVAYDRTFRNLFMTSFGSKNPDESTEWYRMQIESIVNEVGGKDAYLDYSDSEKVAMQVSNLLQTARYQFKEENYSSVFFICTAVIEQMILVLQECDDSHGEIAGTIDEAVEILFMMADQKNIGELHESVYNFCLSIYDQEIFEGFAWNMDLLNIAGTLVRNAKEAEQVLARLKKADQYETHTAEIIEHQIIYKIRGEAEAEAYLEEHLSNKRFRTDAIEKAFQRKDYTRARRLAEEGYIQDKDDLRGQANSWYNWLLKIAMAEGNTKEIIERARYLFFDRHNAEQDYYEILKKHVPTEKWKIFVEGLIKEVRKNSYSDHSLARIYIKEQYWERLLELVKKSSFLMEVATYEPYLADKFPHELINKYGDLILKFLEQHTGRKYYGEACRYLDRMKKLGGTTEVIKIVSFLRQTYPRRSALMQELKNV